MATRKLKLTQPDIENEPLPEPAGYDAKGRPRTAYTLLWDTERRGLGVRITSGGARSFVVERVVRGTGRSRRVTLGAFRRQREGGEGLTLAQARRRAEPVLARMAEGHDPSAERRAARFGTPAPAETTLGAAFDQYLADRELRPRSAADTRRHRDATFADLLERPIVSITAQELADRYRELRDAARADERSMTRPNQGFRILRAVLNHARDSFEHADGSPVLEFNPADSRRLRRMWVKEKARRGRVPRDSWGKWWAMLQARRADANGNRARQTALDAIAITALTGLRSQNVAGGRREGVTYPGMLWSQLDLEAATLTLGPEVMKTDEPVTIPLARQAVEILRARQAVATGNRVFAGRDGDDSFADIRGALDRLGRAAGVPHVSPHDIRRSFREIANEAGVEYWKTKALMAHKLENSNDVTLTNYTELHDLTYLRDDVQAVADLLDERAAAYTGDNVTTMHAEAETA